MFKMNNQKATIQQMAASEVTKVALVTALYIVITTLLSVVSFGVFQLRLSEMFNCLTGVIFGQSQWVLPLQISTHH